MPHLLAAQAAVALEGVGHAMPQPPQWAASVVGSTHPLLQQMVADPALAQSASLSQRETHTVFTHFLPIGQLSFCGRHATHAPVFLSQRGAMALHWLSAVQGQPPSQPPRSDGRNRMPPPPLPPQPDDHTPAIARVSASPATVSRAFILLLLGIA